MSNDSSKKGQQDKSDDNYNPPSSPGLFSNESERETYYKDKQDYDKSWEVTKAQQDQADDKYKPPSTPSMCDSDRRKEIKWAEREAYDKSWEDSQENSDNQEEEKKDGCFITTACVKAHKLPDNCLELQTLRNFRDTFLIQLPDGNNLITEYYNTAPKIVDKINRSPQKDEIYNWLYDELIKKSIYYINCGDNLNAYKNYKSIFQYLKQNMLTKDI